MPISFPDSGHRVRVHQSAYVHTASDGTQTLVAIGTDEERWYREKGKIGRIMLPALPNRSHGRYFAEQLVTADSPRRAYRQIHDDWMLPDPHPAYTDKHGIRPGSRRERREYGYRTQPEIDLLKPSGATLMVPDNQEEIDLAQAEYEAGEYLRDEQPPVFDPKED